MEFQRSRIPRSSVGIRVDSPRLIPRFLSIPQCILSFPGHFKVPRKLLRTPGFATLEQSRGSTVHDAQMRLTSNCGRDESYQVVAKLITPPGLSNEVKFN